MIRRFAFSFTAKQHSQRKQARPPAHKEGGTGHGERGAGANGHVKASCPCICSNNQHKTRTNRLVRLRLNRTKASKRSGTDLLRSGPPFDDILRACCGFFLIPRREGKILHVLPAEEGGLVGREATDSSKGVVTSCYHSLVIISLVIIYHFTCYHLSFHVLFFLIFIQEPRSSKVYLCPTLMLTCWINFWRETNYSKQIYLPYDSLY